jgi:hypothetical protein
MEKRGEDDGRGRWVVTPENGQQREEPPVRPLVAVVGQWRR